MTKSMATKNTWIIIGLGLMGASFAKAAKAYGLCDFVIGVDKDKEVLKFAKEQGIIDLGHTELGAFCEHAQLIMLSVPMLSMDPVMQALSHWKTGHAIISDMGSVKYPMLVSAQKWLKDRLAFIVLGHPIAGSEKSGVHYANQDLFQKHLVILCPLEITPDEGECSSSMNQLRQWWTKLGAQVEIMSAVKHDEMLAMTSHLPHLLSFCMTDSITNKGQSLDVLRYASGGFRDFTRIAGSHPQMWSDIVLSNKDFLLQALEQFLQDAKQMRMAIEADDQHALTQLFTRANGVRKQFERLGDRNMIHSTKPILNYRVEPGGCLVGEVLVPGDKSISHRSIMLGSIATGETTITGFLEGEDALATLAAFRAMGVSIVGPDAMGRMVIQGVGLHGLKKSSGPLNMGNSGTSMRLMAGLLSAQSFDSTLYGDTSLSKRPMGRVIAPLSLMGAKVESNSDGKPPLSIQGGCHLSGIHYELPMASAQVKSCLLLAGLYAHGDTLLIEKGITRDHTERMLKGFGYPIEVVENTIKLTPGFQLMGTDIQIPADISSAAFFMVAATIAKGSDITLVNVGINPTRTGVIDILKLMGADIEIFDVRESGGEPIANIRVQHAPLTGIEIPTALVPLAIDEFPVLFVAAACAHGTTVLREAEELRVKESDRIQVMADGLIHLGIEVTVLPDGIIIQGGTLRGGEVESHGDHRIAMAFTVASLKSSGAIRIRNCANVATSFPKFTDLVQSLGIRLETYFT